MAGSSGIQTKRRRTLHGEDQRSPGPSSSALADYEDSLTEPESIQYAGRIIRLHMVNFLCHNNLEIKFNPRINFINGRNGSGKSAIMVALVTVLGGSASATGRGSAVTDFIKKGETHGRLTVEIMNEGVNAYRPDEYGDRITIIRAFTASGSNTYTVKAATGAIISRRKQEVDRIVEVLRMDVKNPICVLNQDVARSFLTSTDSKLRYNLFLEATQMKKLAKLHDSASDQLTESWNDLKRKTELLDEANEEVNELKSRLDHFDFLENEAKEMEQLRCEHHWASVVADEEALEAAKEEKITLERKIAKFSNDLLTYQAKIDAFEEEANQLKQNLEKVAQKKKEVSDQKRTVNAEVLQVQNEVTRQENQLNLTLPKLRRTLADIERIKEHIQEIEQRNDRSKAEHAEVVERIRAVEAELKENKERYVAAERDLENANETKVRTRDELSAATAALRDVERNKAHKINQLEGMRGQGDMEALRFGAFVPRLLQAVDAAVARKQFSRKPIGPLGMHVALNCDPKWAPAIESVVGGLMTSYCCDNDHDFKVLSKILNDLVGKKQPSIIISKFQPTRHNVSRNRVKVPGQNTIMDNLTFHDDTVFNTFIDQAGIEGILLFERDEQAAAMLTHVENVPSGLRMGVTLGCDRYYPAPNYRTYAGRSTSRFFNQSNRREDVITKLESEIKSLEREVVTRTAEVKTLQASLTKMDDFARRSDARLRELRQRRGALEMELSQLKDKEDSRPVPRTRTALEEELTMLETQKEECERERVVKQETIDKVLKSGEAARQKLDQLNAELELLQEEISRIETQLNKSQDDKNAQEFAHRNWESQLTSFKRQLNENSEKQAILAVELEQRTAEAMEACPERVLNPRSPVEISKLLDSKEKYLRAAENITGSRSETLALYRERSSAFEEKQGAKEKLYDDIKFFTRSVQHRINIQNEMLRLCASEVSKYFRAALGTRKYDGSLQFDYDEGRLELEVVPHAHEQGRSDAKTLSGGERSYSTVSFILAMWRAVMMPFYFLDEFDVFMDKVNRRVVMDLLMQHAKENTNTQFVFITPQDISTVVATEDISVFVMPDPVRTEMASLQRSSDVS